MSESELIETLFAPLAREADGAYGLADDAARLDFGSLIVSKDMMIAGVHFRPQDPLDLVARKLLRANLSDLAAKGARPIGYFLACAWPVQATRDDIALFAQGLKEDQEIFRIQLFGGDTTRHKAKSAPLTLSATIFGAPPRGASPARAGAAPGDDIYVTGSIGDAGLGLKALLREDTFTKVDRASLAGRYHLPEPRLSLGAAIAGLATAALDVSDGLLIDAGRIAAASAARLEIDAVSIPRSVGAGDWVARQDSRWRALAALSSFGDDYEILFTAPASLRRSVTVAAKASRTEVSRIGVVKKGEGAALIDEAGREIAVGRAGYDHFTI